MHRTVRGLSVVAIALFVMAAAGCAAGTPETPRPDTPEDAARELAVAKATFAQACREMDPRSVYAGAGVDETFCIDVHVDGVTADGISLTVPTGLGPRPASAARAATVCGTVVGVLSEFRSDDDGVLLVNPPMGYEHVTILDENGETVATCSAGPTSAPRWWP